MAQRLVFDSMELDSGLDDRSRFLLWRELYTSIYGAADVERFGDSPFRMRTECLRLGDVGLTRSAGNFSRYSRVASHVAADARGDFVIGFVRGQARIRLSQRDRQTVLGAGQLALFTNAEPLEGRAEHPTAWDKLTLPRARLLDLVVDAEELAIRAFDASQPAVRHLARYVEFLLNAKEIAEEPDLVEHARTTLFDLVVLSFGIRGDAADLAATRGLRAVRTREIIAEIKAGFTYPGFSARHVAVKLGLSPRYVQDLLQETGVNFTDRVMELRLQGARTILSDPRRDNLKVSEVALACGFGEISYFNQCFRRRFGGSPTQFRSGERS